MVLIEGQRAIFLAINCFTRNLLQPFSCSKKVERTLLPNNCCHSENKEIKHGRNKGKSTAKSLYS